MRFKMRLFKILSSYFPSKLPVGVAEFDKWANSIIYLSGHYADLDSMKFALATMIMHLGAQKASISKQYFVRSLRKTASNQVAAQIFQDIKEKQKAQQAAAAESAAVVDTLIKEDTSENKVMSGQTT